MTTPKKTPARPAAPVREAEPPALPLTTEERLRHIEALAQRINGYVQFMGEVGSLRGTSPEAKERAVTAFFERMVVLERQLGQIHEDLRLG